MPKIDGKEYPYTEEGKKAAAAAKKKKGKKGSFSSKYLSLMPGDKEKYAKGRERQEEIDRGERFVGKKTGTIDTSKGKAKAKKHAKGVQRAGEYVQKDEELADRLWNSRAHARDLESASVDFIDVDTGKGARSQREFDKFVKKHQRRVEAPQRRLDREYPKSAKHKADVHLREVREDNPEWAAEQDKKAAAKKKAKKTKAEKAGDAEKKRLKKRRDD